MKRPTKKPDQEVWKPPGSAKFPPPKPVPVVIRRDERQLPLFDPNRKEA